MNSVGDKYDGLFQDYIATLFLLASIILYIPIMTLLVLRKKTQPIRHRSPYLMMISVLCSFIFVISLSMVLYLNPRDNNINSFTCNLYIYNNNILHFILILPYIFRAFRLLNVFNYKYFNSNFHKTKLREAYYLKMLIVTFVLMSVTFVTIYFSNNLYSVFPVDIEVCFIWDKTNCNLLLFKVIWISLHITECLVVLMFVIKLRKVRDEFNISNELMTVGLVWLGLELIFISNSSITKFLNQNEIIILDVIRNYITVIVSGMFPIIKSFKMLNLPICTTKECAANFNLLLITEKTYDAFFDYLKSYMPEGVKFLSFWTELNVFKHSKTRSGEINILSTDIYYKYLNENSEMYIDFPANLIENLHKSYQDCNKNMYNDVFEGLGDYVYNTLKDYYYPNFKMSNEYRKLESDLEIDEIIYSRLVASSMISSLEIE